MYTAGWILLTVGVVPATSIYSSNWYLDEDDPQLVRWSARVRRAGRWSLYLLPLAAVGGVLMLLS